MGEVLCLRTCRLLVVQMAHSNSNINKNNLSIPGGVGGVVCRKRDLTEKHKDGFD